MSFKLSHFHAREMNVTNSNKQMKKYNCTNKIVELYILMYAIHTCIQT